MGGVVVLNPQDVLNYNRMPLISPSPSKNHELMKSRVHNNPNFIPNFNSNRRKRSPQKKTSDLNKTPPKSSNFDKNFNGSKKKIDGLSKSPPKSLNFDQKVNGSQKKPSDLCRLAPKSSNFDQKVNCGRGVHRFSAEGGAHLTDVQVSSANKLVMEKVKILKRGEALTNEDEVDKENKYENVVNLENKGVKNTEKKMVLSDEENNCEKVVNVVENGDKKTEKKVFDKGNKYEKVVNLEKDGDKKTEKKMVLFDKANKYVKVVNLGKNGVKKTEKKMVSFGKDSKSKKKIGLEKVVDLNRKHDLESVELLMRLGPEPGMLPKKIHLADFYAGSAFVDSPDPSSLPFPPFLKKGTTEIELAPKINDSNDNDNGSSHLRKLLKLAF